MVWRDAPVKISGYERNPYLEGRISYEAAL